MSDKENFEKRLLSELRQVSAENPAPVPESEPVRPRKYGRFAAAGAGLAAVVAGIAIYTSTGDNTTSAYAVEKQSDGKVAVEITDLKEAEGLEESLAAAGVPARVTTAPMSANICKVKVEAANEQGTKTEADGDVVKAIPARPAAPGESGRTSIPVGAEPVRIPIEIRTADADGASFSIDPDSIPKGQKVIITPSEGKPTDQLIPAGAPSAPPIAVSIGAPAYPPC